MIDAGDLPPGPLILASSSPRRRSILRNLGLQFVVHPPRVDECPEEGLSAGRLVIELARRKAEQAAQAHEHGLVVGVDTIVSLQGSLMGKPKDKEQAAAMLRRMSGRTHEVVSGIAVLAKPGGRLETALERTLVTMRRLTDKEIRDYVETGEPLDKAGGYGIQGVGGLLVSRILGCYYNVVGLPLVRLDLVLRRFGYNLLEKAICRGR